MTDLLPLSTWLPIADGDPIAAAIYLSHYSSERSRARRIARGTKLIVGPGYKLLLSTPCRRGLLAWRKQKHRRGVECTIFSNDGAGLASELIRAADLIADRRWPGEPHFTYVDPSKVKGDPPGNCFRRAGYVQVGITKRRKLLLLERPPA